MAWRESMSFNNLMVDKFVRLGIIESKQVENAFRCVSRAAFVPEDLISEAFIDAPIRGSPHLHMSAPHMYAAILEDLELEPGMSFLNVGSGTGYFSSLAGYLMKKGGINHGIELHEDLVKFANECVDDFIEHGGSEAKDICRPVFISGNCFCLDVDQMKYDRVYCGAACPSSKVRFLLELVRVGGFLIAPVGTRLIKLERISPRDGRQTVITDVCFASLISPKPGDLRQPKLRFPTSCKKKKDKEKIKPNVSFPIGKSKSKRMLARLRALQDVLECLETGDVPPLPFCYVPSMEQMNRLKMTDNIMKQLQELATSQRIAKGSSLPAGCFPAGSITSPFHPHWFLTRNQVERRRARSQRSRLISAGSTHPEPTLVHLKEASKKGDGTKDLPKDIWEHLSTDKTWLDVLEYYYSLCCTDDTNKKECFRVKALELCSNAEKVKAILSFRSLARKSGLMVDQESASRKTSSSKAPYVEGVADGIVQSLLEEVLAQVDKNSHDAVTTTLLEYLSSTDALNEAESEDLSRALLLDNLPQLGQMDEPNVDTTTICNDSVDSGILECSTLSQDISSPNTSELPCHSQDEQMSSLSPNPRMNSCIISKKAGTSCTKQKARSPRKSTKPLRKWVNVEIDEQSMECLQMKPGRDWSLDLDFELVCFLTKKDKGAEPNSVPENYPKIIRPEIFAKQSCGQFTKISSYPGTVLAYRAILLKRVADILDSVMEFIVGPSLKREQFKNPFEKKYPLSSFTDKSFVSSGIPLNVDSQSDVVKPVWSEKGPSQVVAPDSEILTEVEEMITHEISNVAHQQDIIIKKLELIDSLDEQYKEQIRLLKQQIDLIEEQQQLLKDCEIHVDNLDDANRERLIQTQQLVLERKEHRQQLMIKLDTIKGQQKDQQTERYDLLQMRQQLVSLEGKLLAEKSDLFSKGVKYLRDDGPELSNFSKFVRKSGEILQKLKDSEDRVLGKGSVRSDDSYSLADLLSTKDASTNQMRYQPELILSKGRFLLPLTSKRPTIVKDFLRSSELPAPKHIPVISLDRRVPIGDRHLHQTIFMQLYASLLHKDLHYRWSKKTFDQWWEVKFTGEGIIDQGGGFRDSLAEISDELCPVSSIMEPSLPLFIKTPNHRNGIGEHQDAYIPNPSCRLLSLYRWFGQLMGACYRTDETIPLSFPPMVWKVLIEEPVFWKTDYWVIDEVAVRVTDGFELFDSETFERFYSNETFFVTTLSDGKEKELLKHGEERMVTSSDKSLYAGLVRRARMLESIEQMKAIKDGLTSAVPQAVLSCLTWRDLERAVCGDGEITVSDLKSNCRYGDDLSATCDCVQHMWAALTHFTSDERSRFLRFVTGRRRLPSPFIVSRSSSDQDTLPSASTCGSNLFLPNYSDEKVAEEKIRYAIHHCVAIDTDTSPW